MGRIVPFEIVEAWRKRRFGARDHARWIEEHIRARHGLGPATPVAGDPCVIDVAEHGNRWLERNGDKNHD